MPTQTINLNNTTPAAPAGALNIEWQADPPSLDPSVSRNVSAYFSAFTGDTGPGGTMGLVPAPPPGAAAAGKLLKADGTWSLTSSGMTNPMTTQGDLIVGGAAGAPTRLAAGTAGQVLQANGASALPGWVTPSSGGGGGSSTAHSEPLTDGNGNLIFASTLLMGGDVIIVVGVAN